MMKLQNKWATRSLLLKKFATRVKELFTEGKVETRLVKQVFL